jgi:hypothetical protein
LVQVQGSFLMSVPSATLPITATGAGNLVVLGFIVSPNTDVTVTDNAGNTYTEIAQAHAVDGIATTFHDETRIVYASGSRAGATGVSLATQGMGNLESVVLWEVAGIATSGAVDVAGQLSSQTATTSPLGAPLTTTATGDFILDIAYTDGTISSAATGFVEDSAITGDGWAHLGDAHAPPGMYHVQWTSTNDTYCASSAAFFAAP